MGVVLIDNQLQLNMSSGTARSVDSDLTLDALAPLVERSATIKAEVVREDPRERGTRKALNFGHTIGHGIEAYSWEAGQRALLHGEAVAIGMVCEAWLSWRLGLLDRTSKGRIITERGAEYLAGGLR